jgi:flavodoxin
MKTLIACYSETGNTAQIADAICDELSAAGLEADLKKIGPADRPAEVGPDTLAGYDLVFLGSACHDADLARPVKELLAAIPPAAAFKLAGFVTHASYTPEGGDREQELHDTWASRCALSFRQASQEKGFDYLGYFGCQGAPSPPIEQFIHSAIVTDEDEWQAYVREVRKHPDEEDLRRARAFARQVLAQFQVGQPSRRLGSGTKRNPRICAR